MHIILMICIYIYMYYYYIMIYYDIYYMVYLFSPVYKPLNIWGAWAHTCPPGVCASHRSPRPRAVAAVSLRPPGMVGINQHQPTVFWRCRRCRTKNAMFQGTVAC